MHKFLIAAVLAAAPQLAFADICKDYGDNAAEIMTLRQNNDKMSDVMTRAAGNAILTELIIAAYNYPLMQVQKNKTGLIGEFRNDRELFCYKTMGDIKP